VQQGIYISCTVHARRQFTAVKHIQCCDMAMSIALQDFSVQLGISNVVRNLNANDVTHFSAVCGITEL
jgi:hypothetical protein